MGLHFTWRKSRTFPEVPGQKGFGRTPRHGASPQQRRPQVDGMRRSTKVGVYLYLASTRKLTSEQKAFLAHTQGKLNYDELNRALRIYSDLCSDQRLRARLGVENTTVPALPPPRRPKEQRRIGIGYRDKGSLRPPHRPSLPGGDTISTDQEELLRSTFQDPPLPEAG
jgi:hypothetical protein